MGKLSLPAEYRLPEHYQQRGQRVVLRRVPCVVPHHIGFELGTCQGALRCGATAYELLAVVNTRPGNGDFQTLLKHLRALGRAHRRDLLGVEVTNAGLYASLQRTAGMEPVPGTRHLLLRIAGPGSCPPHLLESRSHPLVDKLLAMVTREAGNLPGACT